MSVLPTLYASADEKGSEATKNALNKPFTLEEIFKALEKIYPGYSEMPEETQLNLCQHTSIDKLAKILAGDTLYLDRELTALRKAEIAAQDFYGNNNPDNVVAIVFGEAHDFSNACKQLNCRELTTVTFKGGEAYEQIVIAGAASETDI